MRTTNRPLINNAYKVGDRVRLNFPENSVLDGREAYITSIHWTGWECSVMYWTPSGALEPMRVFKDFIDPITEE